jgi:hypothetical protein
MYEFIFICKLFTCIYVCAHILVAT